MATLEDKILGEKLHNYCSSSSEGSEDEDDSTSEATSKTVEVSESSAEVDTKWEGTSKNTGPKGVIKDWQRYKQLESEKRAEQDMERIALARKLTLTVQSALDEEKEKAALEDPELAELLNDDFLLEYQKKRMQEMLQQSEPNVKFGKLIYLKNGQEYLDAIDKEHKLVTVIIHIYEEYVEACRAMNSCLVELARMHEGTKFCAIVGSQAGLSREFKANGLPALLIYKGGLLISNFVRLTDDLGSNFYMEDVRDFLVEHGLLEDKSCLPLIIREGESSQDDSE
ncbi:hypothetical protein ILUMI_08225 [Ignelater luminosus]|uniref:Phosducin domain-containing protein n=1 Tax=Ignelater luminosus TaxID=2038154 RepID=A0A8K0D211_IGNLU|nr:hypothetical protein ILUMI_08225 [Ignelater luminosus]